MTFARCSLPNYISIKYKDLIKETSHLRPIYLMLGALPSHMQLGPPHVYINYVFSIHNFITQDSLTQYQTHYPLNERTHFVSKRKSRISSQHPALMKTFINDKVQT